MMTHTEDRTVLITGGATRIGKHIALGLAKDGWNVAVHYNESESEAVDLLQSLKNMGVKSVAVKANLAHEDSTINLIATIRKELGNIHGLVNNASMFSFDRPEQFDRSNLEKHMAVNLYAPLRLTSEFAKQIPQNELGCVINLLDQKTHNLNSDFFSYTLSKVALETATKLFASALGPKLRVCGLAPGITLPSGEQTDSGFETAHKLAPLGKSSVPEDIVSAVKYLLNANAITGTTLIVDGGQHLWPTKRDVQFEIKK
ncbi:MAG: SDR family oxidoreductase [Burkholderiales bacterium]|tara:strand:- start:8037 stop:8810 length:774 start_codon:yes stop_codon:yes gene_type:complete